MSKLIKVEMKIGTSQQTDEQIQRIIRANYRNLYSTKLENRNEKEQFFDIHNLPKFSQDQISNF